MRFDLARKGRFHVAQARIMESLGNPGDQRQISLIAVHTYGIPDDFPESVITESKSLPPPKLEGRTDLRGAPPHHHRSARRARPRRRGPRRSR